MREEKSFLYIEYNTSLDDWEKDKSNKKVNRSIEKEFLKLNTNDFRNQLKQIMI